MNRKHLVLKNCNVQYLSSACPVCYLNQAWSEYKHSLTFRVRRCCHSNETRAPIANPPNSAQLKGTPYHSPKLHPGPCNSVGMRRGADRHTDGRDNIHLASATPHANVMNDSDRKAPFRVRA